MEQSLKKVTLSMGKLPLLESSQCIAHTLDVFKKQGFDFSDEKRPAIILNRLNENLPAYEKAIKKDKAKLETMSVKEADERRDYDIRALFSIVSTHKHSSVSEKQKAYQLLSKLFKEYKGIQKASYEKETAMIKNLLEKLNLTHYQTALQTLNAREFVDNLIDSQKQFYQIYLDNEELNSVETITGTKLRKQIESDYQLLYNYLYEAYKVDQSPLFKQCILAMNEIRQNYVESTKRSTSAKEEPVLLLE